MNRNLILTLLLAAACTSAEERAVDDALRNGNALFDAGDTTQALREYDAAPEDHRTRYNAGLGLHGQGSLEEAVDRFSSAFALADSAADRNKATYALGHTWALRATLADTLARMAAREARSIRLEGDINDQVRQMVLRDSLQRMERNLIQLTDSALEAGRDAYRDALRMDPGDEQARHNLTLVERAIAARRPGRQDGREGDKDKQDKELGLLAKRIMAQADSMVERYRFQDALDLMQGGLLKDPTLEQRKDYMDKLGTITRTSKTP
jgi:tetratricopeptide (TPR) repeat protein